MTTATALGVQASIRFKDPNFRIISAAQWLQYTNQCYEKVNAASMLWPWLESAEQIVTVLNNTRSIALPANMWQVNWVYNVTSDYRMIPQEGRGDQWHQDHLRSEVGQPVTYRLRGNTLEVFPMPQADTQFALEGMAYPVDLAGSDSPIYPPQFHNDLLDGMIALAYLDDGSTEQYTAHWAAFMAAIKKMSEDILQVRTETYVPVRDVFWS